jgi:peptidoglycan hydrolase-like protein with peptidoglycan-binding domain
MFYTDDELSKLNPDKKNFDTLALQRELNNRGYELPKSKRKEKYEDLIRRDYMPDIFDGVFGEETKQALLDWQSKNKKMYGGKLLPSLNKL